MLQATAAGAFEPFGNRRPRGQPCDLPAEIFGHGQALGRRPCGEGGVGVVVDIANLHGLRHVSIMTCAIACHHKMWMEASPDVRAKLEGVGWCAHGIRPMRRAEAAKGPGDGHSGHDPDHDHDCRDPEREAAA